MINQVRGPRGPKQGWVQEGELLDTEGGAGTRLAWAEGWRGG